MTVTRKKRKNGTSYGWWVRYDFTHDRKPKHHAQFNDIDYGSEKKSFNAAKVYEKFLIETCQKVNQKPIFAKPNKKAKSETDIPGIAYSCYERSGNNGNTYIAEHFVASWQISPYRQGRQQFSVNKYGYNKAFKMAKSVRQKMIG